MSMRLILSGPSQQPATDNWDDFEKDEPGIQIVRLPLTLWPTALAPPPTLWPDSYLG